MRAGDRAGLALSATLIPKTGKEAEPTKDRRNRSQTGRCYCESRIMIKRQEWQSRSKVAEKPVGWKHIIFATRKKKGKKKKLRNVGFGL